MIALRENPRGFSDMKIRSNELYTLLAFRYLFFITYSLFNIVIIMLIFISSLSSIGHETIQISLVHNNNFSPQYANYRPTRRKWSRAFL